MSTGSVLLTGAVCVAVWLLACKPAFPGIPSLPDGLRLAVWILGATYFLFLCDALASFPNGYDAVAYHLPTAVSWLQNASFRLIDLKWTAALPANAELFALPALALNLQGIAFLGNLLATGILALSVYALGMRVSGSNGGAWLAVLIALSIPLVIFQTFFFNVDVFGTAFLAAALVFTFIFAESGRESWAFLAALCCGIGMGTKHVHIPYAGLLLLTILVIAMKQKRWWLAGFLLAVSAAPVTLWIARNSLATGNAAYPFSIEVAGVKFAGARGFPPFEVKPNDYVSNALPVRTAAPVQETAPSPQALAIPPRKGPRITVNEDHGVGFGFEAFAAAGILAAVLETFGKKRISLALLTLAAIGIGGFCWVFFFWTARFALPVFALICVLCSLLYERLAAFHRAIVPALIIPVVAFASIESLAVPAHRTLNRFLYRDWSRPAYYGYPAAVDALPAGARILDRSRDENMGFVLAGARLSFHVLHIEGPLTIESLSRNAVQYAAKDGDVDREDSLLAENGDVIYSGVPHSIFPATTPKWRIYKMRSWPAHASDRETNH